MAHIIATRGHPYQCVIDWSRCNPDRFRDTLLFREAYSDPTINTLQDLMDYIDETDVLSYLDEPRRRGLHEINRCLLPGNARPRIYYEVLGRYFMIEFQPDTRTIVHAKLPVSADLISTWSEFEETIPEFTTWEYTSIKSME
jgi:hypothetical protein